MLRVWKRQTKLPGELSTRSWTALVPPLDVLPCGLSWNLTFLSRSLTTIACGFVLMHISTRYKNGAHQVRPSPRHAGPVDVESDCAWPCARVRHRATARTGVTRRGPGAGRVALPGIAPARKSRPSGCGLERDRDRARGEVLSPDAKRVEAA